MTTDMDEIAKRIADDPTWIMWQGSSMSGWCGHCGSTVDNFDPYHRVTPVFSGGRGVECVSRGDITPSLAAPLAHLRYDMRRAAAADALAKEWD